MGKNTNTKRSKTVVYKCKKKRRYERSEEGKTLAEKSQVYITRLFILLVSQYFYTSVSKKKNNSC